METSHCRSLYVTNENTPPVRIHKQGVSVLRTTPSPDSNWVGSYKTQMGSKRKRKKDRFVNGICKLWNRNETEIEWYLKVDRCRWFVSVWMNGWLNVIINVIIKMGDEIRAIIKTGDEIGQVMPMRRTQHATHNGLPSANTLPWFQWDQNNREKDRFTDRDLESVNWE